MIIAKNDEDKRSKLWRTATLVSSALIVIIAVYLLMKLFMTNPLEGSWQSEDSSMGITIKSNGVVIVNIPELVENVNVDVKMDYTLDKEEKTITIHADEDELKKMSEKSDGQYTTEILENAVSPIAAMFDYSVDKSRLTLTEREYGEQLIFLKE